MIVVNFGDEFIGIQNDLVIVVYIIVCIVIDFIVGIVIINVEFQIVSYLLVDIQID